VNGTAAFRRVPALPWAWIVPEMIGRIQLKAPLRRKHIHHALGYRLLHMRRVGWHLSWEDELDQLPASDEERAVRTGVSTQPNLGSMLNTPGHRDFR
jgi:hypothetical protein